MLSKNELKLCSSPYSKKVTVYSDTNVKPTACILYFHGGGLLYGQRTDLPDLHINTLTRAGYAIAAFDYPLAPAADLGVIVEDVCNSISHYIANSSNYVGKTLPYFLWGRSAGAYLCLIAAAKGEFEAAPKGILSYYGYGFLCDNWFDSPSPYYTKLPAVSESCLEALPKQLHTNGDLGTHYSAYVYARQTGEWLNLLYEGRMKHFYLDFTLRTCDQLPCPLFCAHSTGDTDVPYSEFLELCSRYQPRRFIAPVNEHDFDRDETNSFTEKLLDETLLFLEKCL